MALRKMKYEVKPKFTDFIDSSFDKILAKYSLNFKQVREDHYIIWCEKWAIKIYDQSGHGYSFQMNLSSKYDEEMYCDDEVLLFWVLDYYGIQDKSDFSSRKKTNYIENIPKALSVLPSVIEKLMNEEKLFWDGIREHITKEMKIRKEFKGLIVT